jgi:hypothetical protein
VTKWTYDPSTRDGAQVEQCHTRTRLTFELSGGKPRARRSFIKRWKKVGALIDVGDYDGAAELVDEIRERGEWNLYEYSRLNYLEALIAQGRGDQAGQLAALHHMVGNTGQFVGRDMYLRVLPVILQLELGLSRYSAALETYGRMQEYPELLEDSPDLEQTIVGLQDMIAGDAVLSVPGELTRVGEDDGRWSYAPLRREFAFAEVAGELGEIELRCDWSHYRDQWRPDISWRIPESWGKCRLYVFGDEGATFKYIEYPEADTGRPDDAALTQGAET